MLSPIEKRLPMTHFNDPHGGPESESFGFTPRSRRAYKPHRQPRAQAGGRRGGQPFEFGYGPAGAAGFGVGFGPSGPRGRRRGRGRRGDVRAALLALLSERPMHGYEMIQEIVERSNGLWRPSPGSVYPTLQLLVDEELIVAAETDGVRRLFTLTEVGREAAGKIGTPPWEQIADFVDPNEANLRTAFGQLAAALFQAAHAATPEQQKRIVDLVNTARRDVYGILGETD